MNSNLFFDFLQFVALLPYVVQELQSFIILLRHLHAGLLQTALQTLKYTQTFHKPIRAIQITPHFHMRTVNSRCIRWYRWPSLVLRWFFGFLKPWAPRPSAAELTPGRTSYAALLKSPAPSYKTRRKIGIGTHMRDWIIHKITEDLTVNCTFTYDCLHFL